MSNLSRKVLKMMSVFGSVQSIGIVCSVVRAKLISLWIGPAGVGLFGIFNSVLDLLSTATQLNLRQSAVRDIADSPASEAPAIASAVRWWARVLGLAGAATIIILSPLLSLASFKTIDWWWAFALLSVSMFCLSVVNGEQALMQGTRRLRQLAVSVVAGSVGGTALSVPMYYFLGERSIIPSIIVFALCSVAAVMAMQDIKSARLAWRQNMAKGREFLKLGAYLTVSSLAASAAGYAFRSYLSQVDSIQMVGLYQAGYTLIISYVGVIFTAIGLEFYPRLVSIASRPKMASLIVSHEISLLMCVLCPVVVIFVMCDRLFVQILYTSQFFDIIPMISIGIGAAAFRAFSYCMAYVIVARGDGRCFIAVEVTSAAVGLALNIAFYRWLGLAGLGISYVAWYAVYALMVGCAYRFRYGMRITRKTMGITASACAIIALAIAARHISWYAPLPFLAVAVALAIDARRRSEWR